MSEPLISVLMPVREMRAFSYQAITSMLDQSHQNLELLLVGQDKQPRPAELQTDDRLRWISRKQPGIIGALNTGIAEARGDYIARMDDDDIAYPDRLSIQLRHLLTRQLDICGARIRFFSEENSVGEGNQRYARWLNSLTTPDEIKQSIFIESPIPHPTFFAHKNTWQQLGGYQDNNWPEDYDLLLRAWQLGLRMGKPEQVLLDWREHRNRLTYTDTRYSKQAFVDAKAATLCAIDASPFTKQQSIWIAGTGRNARYWFDALQTHGAPVEGFVDLDRTNIKNSKRHRPVINYEQYLDQAADQFLIIALGNEGARQQCIDWCIGEEMRPLIDFVAG